jgi:hypothetical protein
MVVFFFFFFFFLPLEAMSVRPLSWSSERVDQSEALVVVEPPDGPCGHLCSPPGMCTARRGGCCEAPTLSGFVMIRGPHVARRRRRGAGPDQVSTEHVGVSRDATGSMRLTDRPEPGKGEGDDCSTTCFGHNVLTLRPDEGTSPSKSSPDVYAAVSFDLTGSAPRASVLLRRLKSIRYRRPPFPRGKRAGLGSGRERSLGTRTERLATGSRVAPAQCVRRDTEIDAVIDPADSR